MKAISSIALCVAAAGFLGTAPAQATGPDSAAKVSVSQPSAEAPDSSSAASNASTTAVPTAPTSTSTDATSSVSTGASSAAVASSSTTQQALSPTRTEPGNGHDLLAATVIEDSQLATARGGADTGSQTTLNQNNTSGTVSGNVASQLTTGSNTISENSFSNSSGIPVVIQNSGNNVLIQNSTILNLQLTPPK